jgi:hypothetical protein
VNFRTLLDELASGKTFHAVLLENLTGNRLDPDGWARLERITSDDREFWIQGSPTPLAMKVKKPLTLRRLSNWLASLGIGNHIQAASREIEIRDIVAVTVHVHTRKGEAKSLDIVLEEKWSDPNA